ncbi:MAG: HAMP domain-containing histidine kinase [Ignavibacteria bacterium]|nr:HAMP domain-containing histidine kinase [Ignavibacteria bacterium]
MRGNFFQSLYWKLSTVFLVLLVLVGAVYTYLTLFQTEMYFAETNQRLNAMLADHIVREIQPFVDGKPNFDAMDGIFHDVMVVNPSVEVYLLDAGGEILTFSAPPDKVTMSSVSLEPVREFIASGGTRFVLGDNPRNAHSRKVFSAAPVIMDERLYGYVYVILGGEEYDSVAQRIVDSHILTLGIRGLLLSLMGAAFIGLVSIAFVTRKLRHITKTVNLFKEGDYTQRVTVASTDELDQLGAAFNEMADTITRNIESVRHSDTLRRELIANVSHDLRTPLASMQGYIETVLMKNESLSDEERSDYLKTILSSSERLTNLVHELFELSKLETNQVRPHPEPFSLPELINDLTMKFSPQAEKLGVRLSATTQQGLPFVRADIGLIERVLQNLIENAIKFTPRGGMVVVEAVRTDGKVLTRVRDSGIGIPDEELPHIFNRFYRARTKHDTPGTGLGLSIARKILELHGEEISVKSRMNEGTTFTFELPAA